MSSFKKAIKRVTASLDKPDHRTDREREIWEMIRGERMTTPKKDEKFERSRRTRDYDRGESVSDLIEREMEILRRNKKPVRPDPTNDNRSFRSR